MKATPIKSAPSVAGKLLSCLDCGRCSGICPVSRAGLGYSPRRLIQRAIQSGGELVFSDRALFACLGCDLCATVCPSGISVSALMPGLRNQARNHGTFGEPAHGGLPQTVMRLMAQSPAPQHRLTWLDPACVTAEHGDTLLFVGCAPYFELMFAPLNVTPLTTTRNAIRLLNQVGIKPVLMPDERCCGHDLHWLGDFDNFRRLAERNLAQIRATGVKQVVFLCPECLRTFKLDYPSHFGPLGFEPVHITELLAGKAKLPLGPLRRRVTFHDPCRLGRHLGIYEPPRTLLSAIPELTLAEMEHSRHKATCCGGTAWVECGAAVKFLQKQRLVEAGATGAEQLITACPKCDIHLRCALTESPHADKAQPNRRVPNRHNRRVPVLGHNPTAPDAAPLKLVNIIDLLAESAGLNPKP